jgi:hypothetical protein
MFNAKPAKGTRGFLIRSMIETKNGSLVPTYLFRIYHDNGTFTDYDIYHYDMEIQILEDDAMFMSDDEGNNWIDHSMELESQ